MEDDGTHNPVNNLKKEFSLFWQSILGDEYPAKAFENEIIKNLNNLDSDKLKSLTKSLSDTRRQCHQKLEKIKKEIDLHSAKSESLRLVGGDLSETLNKISELNEMGQKISTELFELDEQLKLVRSVEEYSP